MQIRAGTNRLSASLKRAALPLALILSAAMLTSFYMAASEVQSKERALCQGVAENASGVIVDLFYKAIASGSDLRFALESNTELSESRSGALADEMLKAFPFVTGIAIAPHAVVSRYYPAEEGEALLGHDLLSNPERRDALVKAAESRGPVVSGPFENVDGGVAAFVRYPVFDGDSLWGFVSLTIDVGRFWADAGLEREFPNFSFALTGASGAPGSADTEAGAPGTLMEGAKPAAGPNGVRAAAKLPGVEWTVHAMPSGGWSSRSLFLLALQGFGLFAALLYALVSLGAPREPPAAKKRTVEAPLAAMPAASKPASEPDAVSAVAARTATDAAAPIAAPGAGMAPEASTSAKAPTPATSEEDLRIQENSGIEPRKEEEPFLFPGLPKIDEKSGRSLVFKGPDVKGQLYMPEPRSKALAETGEQGPSQKMEAEAGKSEAGRDVSAESRGDRPALANNPIVSEHRRVPEVPAKKAEPTEIGIFAKAERARRKTGESNGHVLFPAEELERGAKVNLLPAILVVDDSEANREILLRMLSLRGYGADAAASGAEAVNLCGRRSYDLIFLDCLMPEMDGYVTSGRIRAVEDVSKKARIVGMSAKVGDREIERCRGAGMDSLLAKPYTSKDVMEQLKAILPPLS